MRVLLLLLLLSACGDDTCDTDGAGRCTGDGTMMFCERGRWHRVDCEAPTPHCVAQGFHAACIGERVGACDFTTFEDRCVDPHTLEDCALVADADEAIRHRVVCPRDRRCGEVGPQALGPARPPNAHFACYAARPRTPALVTFVRGGVEVGGAPAPPVPFAIPAEGTLELAEGAHVVLLVSERASRLDGPGKFDPDDYAPEARAASAEGTALEEALSGQAPPPIPDDPLLAPAPSGVQEITLIVGEGVPGASSRLGFIRWRCEDDCGREVELRDAGGAVLWRGQGEGLVEYTGPDLDAPATYTLRIGAVDYRVRALPTIPMRDLYASMHDWPITERMSVVAAIHRWRGSRAAAVLTLERTLVEDRNNPELRALIELYRGNTR